MFKDKKNLEILKMALDVIAREEAAKLPTPEECAHITFSEEFERKMESLIKRQSKPYYYLINTVGKRVACVVVALILALTTVTFSVKAIREAVIDFFVEAFEKFSIVGFKDEDIPDSLDYIEAYYAPTYIPEGYELEKTETLENIYSLRYISENKRIHFTQRIIDNNDFYLDTEDSKNERFTVNGYNAYSSMKEDTRIICWNDKYYAYTLCLTGEIDESEIIKIAESVKAE